MPRHDDEIRVPVSTVREATEALEVGAEAVLDRDWDCYPADEKAAAELFVERRFTGLIRTLRALLDQDR